MPVAFKAEHMDMAVAVIVLVAPMLCAPLGMSLPTSGDHMQLVVWVFSCCPWCPSRYWMWPVRRRGECLHCLHGRAWAPQVARLLVLALGGNETRGFFGVLRGEFHVLVEGLELYFL